METNNKDIFLKIKEIFLSSDIPSLDLQELLKNKNIAKFFPELIALKGIQGCPKYHPEGSMFEHTMQTLDAAAEIDRIKPEEKFILMLAALCHDFGKVVRHDCTSNEYSKDDGHDIAGVPLAEKFLRRLTQDEALIKSICKMVRHHLLPLRLFEKKPEQEESKQIMQALAPEVTIQQLFTLAWCDIRGRNQHSHKPLSKGTALIRLLQDDKILRKFMENIQNIQIEGAPPIPLLFEADLPDIARPGQKAEDLIRKAYQIQIDEGITDKESLKHAVQAIKIFILK